MTLAIDIRHRLGTFQLDAQFEAGKGLVALFGRSGSGKTSIINIIAGLVRPDYASIRIDGTVLVDTSGGRFVPRHRRRVGYVFQEGRLFPHLTVRQNLLYGRWFAAKSERADDLDSVVRRRKAARRHWTGLARRPASAADGRAARIAR
jgi:molybdate transport system ATP-binding protein